MATIYEVIFTDYTLVKAVSGDVQSTSTARVFYTRNLGILAQRDGPLLPIIDPDGLVLGYYLDWQATIGSVESIPVGAEYIENAETVLNPSPPGEPPGTVLNPPPPPPSEPPSGPIQVFVSDVEVLEGNNGANTISFNVSISEPLTNGSLTVSLAEINPAFGLPNTNNNLEYKNASILTDDIFDLTSSPFMPTSITFGPGKGNVIPINLQIKGDQFIEPDEKFSIRISSPISTTDGRVVIVTDDTAIGTIRNDDGINDTPKGNVSWRGADGVSSDLQAYVTADVEAAIARLDAKPGVRLPSLEVTVQPWSFTDGTILAGAVPVYTKKITGLYDVDSGKKNLTMVLPLAAYEKLTGKDLNGSGPDLKIFVNIDQMENIYSGSILSKDGTSLMLHEIMHGLGVGVLGRAQYEAPWYYYEPDKNDPRLTKDGHHLVSPDLMRERGVSPNEVLEKHHIKILNHLGYGSKAPDWWTGRSASKPSGVDEPNTPSAFKTFEPLDRPQAEQGLSAARDVWTDWLLV